MRTQVYLRSAAAVLVATVWLVSVSAEAASPTAQQALKLSPIQDGIDYSQPASSELAKCTIKARKVDGKVGWIVSDSTGLPLRNFMDTNGDNVYNYCDDYVPHKNGYTFEDQWFYRMCEYNGQRDFNPIQDRIVAGD